MPQKPFIKGRGALANPHNRFASIRSEREADGWDLVEEPAPSQVTEVLDERAKTIIAKNDSPDIPFSQSINPYRGCEHGCIYCFARPSHAYWDLSPGLDFETKLIAKPNAAELLEQALNRPSYRCSPIALGSNTDCYQPLEKERRITRAILEVLQRYRHPFSIVTKSTLVLRDLDILQEMAKDKLCTVMISVTTLDNELKRVLEPRAASPSARLRTIEALAQADVPVGVLASPMIPMVNDAELEQILEACSHAGATSAAYILVRLPHELKELFKQWLETHYPQRAEHVMSLIRQSRDGRENDPSFGQRMTGTGLFADLLRQRFHLACRKHGLNQRDYSPLDCSKFQRPSRMEPQLSLF